LRFEATTLWQIFNTFFIGHAIFIGFVSTALVKNKINDINFVLLLIAGIVGLLLSLLWLGTFHGNSKWYYFRMKKQAKKAESSFVNCIKDDNWYLLNKKAKKFANRIQFKNKNAGYGMIIIFILIYLFIILWSLYKINCTC
jgi:hypothetical membrane protein